MRELSTKPDFVVLCLPEKFAEKPLLQEVCFKNFRFFSHMKGSQQKQEKGLIIIESFIMRIKI